MKHLLHFLHLPLLFAVCAPGLLAGCNGSKTQPSASTLTGPTVSLSLEPKNRGSNTELRILLFSPEISRDDRSLWWSDVVDEATFDVITGTVSYDSETQTINALQLKVTPKSLSPAGLLNPIGDNEITAIRKQWIDGEKSDPIRFTAGSIRERKTGEWTATYQLQDWNYMVSGDLYVGGKSHPVDFPARYEFFEESVTIRAELWLDREELGWADRFSREDYDHFWLPRCSKDVLVTLEISDRSAAEVVRDDVQVLRGYLGDKDRQQQYRIEELERQVAMLSSLVHSDHPKVNALYEAFKAENTADLPDRFTDRLTVDNGKWRDDLSAEFDMIFVPGDPEKGIEAFYMSATEVPWEMMRDWAYSNDIDPVTSARLQQLGLRPSPAYQDGAPFRWIQPNQPAMALSYRTAVGYCSWLSEQTGRVYRVPTYEEWNHAFELGGGIPENREALLDQAHLRDRPASATPPDGPFDPFADPDDPLNLEEELKDGNGSLKSWASIAITQPVGAKTPNAMGLYDMLGNAAEWVTPDERGRNRVVGGHYLLKAEELTADWMEYEDQSQWNATYPQRPRSQSWYLDYPLTGIRLVCEPVNIPE